MKTPPAFSCVGPGAKCISIVFIRGACALPDSSAFHLPWVEKCLCTLEHASGTIIPWLDPAGIT